MYSGGTPKVFNPCLNSSCDSQPSPFVSNAWKASIMRCCRPICVAINLDINFSKFDLLAMSMMFLMCASSAVALKRRQSANQLCSRASCAVGRADSSTFKIDCVNDSASAVAPPIIPQSGLNMTAAAKSVTFFAAKGNLPASRRKIITPHDQMSQAFPAQPNHTSGAMYGGVPEMMSVRSQGSEKTSARPKSTTTTCIFSTVSLDASMIFSGFKSL
mmetsp:Transcript_50585/g.134636  ORF Transcript_50585/g.134636 Transcript_50585/m.134636 type:complete len:216 (+) Transcript_50585:766-1413(+)